MPPSLTRTVQLPELSEKSPSLTPTYSLPDVAVTMVELPTSKGGPVPVLPPVTSRPSLGPEGGAL
jgi:hypothetical protein